MDRLEQYRIAIRTVFAKHLEWSKSNDRGETIAICNEETDNYLLMNVGWNGYQRLHSIFFHLRIIDGKIHIEWNGTEDIAEDLMEQGIPESAFVPAFRHPNFRDAIATKT